MTAQWSLPPGLAYPTGQVSDVWSLDDFRQERLSGHEVGMEEV